MDKQTFLEILEASLLAFDGVSQEEIVNLGITKKNAQIGIKFYEYLNK